MNRQFKFDYFLKSRTLTELKRRVDSLVNSIQKEFDQSKKKRKRSNAKTISDISSLSSVSSCETPTSGGSSSASKTNSSTKSKTHKLKYSENSKTNGVVQYPKKQKLK